MKGDDKEDDKIREESKKIDNEKMFEGDKTDSKYLKSKKPGVFRKICDIMKFEKKDKYRTGEDGL